MRLPLIVCLAAVAIAPLVRWMPIASAHPQAGAPQPGSAPVSVEPSAAERLCAERNPRCDWMALVGTLERASLQRVIAAQGYVIDPAPWGKVIAKIHIHNEDVFAENTRVLRLLNVLHATTRAKTIRAELVIEEGEIWDQARVDETARRLRDPLWTSVVAVLPIASADPTKVELLVVTRDVWSLRANTHYTFSADGDGRKLTMLSIIFSENNFLGRRTVIAAAVEMDQGEIAIGPFLIDKNLFGKRLDLRIRGDALFNRDALLDGGTLVREGSASEIALSKPLWSLASTWAAGGTFKHRFEIERLFRGTSLQTYDNPDTPEVELIPFRYRLNVMSAKVNATRQWGTHFKHQISAGYDANSQRPALYQFDPAADADTRAAFARDVLPRSEVTSGPYVELTGLQPVWKTLRNLQTYDLGEDVRYGPEYSVLLGVSPEALGASANSLRASASVGWTYGLSRDGFLRGTMGAAVRYQPSATESPAFLDDVIDNTAFGRIRIATPTYRVGRFVVEAALQTRWNDTQNRFFTIGSDNGLRGFVINEFQGQRVLGTQVEARSLPYELWLFRIGGVAFYEIGGAANSLRALRLHQDIGVGVRFLIPQLSRDLFRFDLAFPLDGAAAGTLRFIGGFESVF